MNEALEKLFDVLKRAWRTVAVITLVCVGACALFLLFAPPQYQSTAVTFVSTPRDTEATAYRGDEYSRQRLTSYAVLGASPELAQRVIDVVGLDVTPAELIGRTIVAPIPETVLLSVIASAPSPAQAQEITTAYVSELTRTVAALEAVPGGLTPRAELILVQPPTYEEAPAGLASWMLIGAAGVGGLILSSFVVVVAALLDGRIRTRQDAVEATGSPVLAVFDFRRVGDPRQRATAAGESARALRTALDALMVQAPRVAVVAPVDSGPIASTVARRLARVLRDRGSTVVHVDLDTTGADNADPPSPTVANLLAAVSDDASATTRAATRAATRPGRVELAVTGDVATVALGERSDDAGATADDPRLPTLLADLAQRYEWVVVNTAPTARSNDPLRLAPLSTTVVMAARLGASRFDQLKLAAADFERVGRRAAGVVLLDGQDDATT